VATTVVSDLEVRRMERKMAALDDETLLFVILGLLMEPQEGTRFTPKARMSARLAFFEVCTRWVPLETYGPAFHALMGDEDDDA
jgi:hypothetical protein